MYLGSVLRPFSPVTDASRAVESHAGPSHYRSLPLRLSVLRASRPPRCRLASPRTPDSNRIDFQSSLRAAFKSLYRLRQVPRLAPLFLSRRQRYNTQISRQLAGARIIYWGKVPRPLPDAFFSGLRALGVTGFDFCWECDDRSQWERYSDAVLKKSKKHGFSFFVWTLNRPAYMKRAIAAGVDGIETDFPKRFVACCR